MNFARRFGLSASLLAFSLTAVSAGAAENVLRRPNSAEPESLDPQKITGLSEANVVRDLFEPLITLDADRHPVAGAASSWDVSPDAKTWTFHLRPGRSDAGLYNHCGYANPAFDALMDKAAHATDITVRRTALQDAERLLLADYPLVPLQFGVANYLVNPRLVGRRDTLPYPQTRYLSFKD